ncbi:necrosis inducing protein-domain-containing protein [Xylariaceae sp. FL1651]|nr:necrosis inducing protein-domain-containing protein [Xylariaceae sp. FL1651]
MPSQHSFAATGLALLMATTTNAFPFKLVVRDPPQALPAKATANDLMFQPAMDFDTDGCYNTPAIGPDGTINPGLDHENTGLAQNCHDLSDLQNNNVYSRARCNNGWCGYIYDYYFEKDVVFANVPFDVGHRNDWEHIAVWVQNGVPKYVAASMHGGYEIKAASDVRWDGTHPKMVYNKDGLGSHDFRFANTDDDNIENATGEWFYGALVSWNGFPNTALRDKLSAYDFGSATMAIRDANFSGNLNEARGSFIPEFDINLDVGSPGNP